MIKYHAAAGEQAVSESPIKYTSYAVVRVWNGFRLRQHGTFHPHVCGFSARSAAKPHTNNIKYRSAEGKKTNDVSRVK
jgi:hypothetical protein